MQPFFSIIVPTYNREKHISETISSVLSQSFQDFELLVIDNKSQDKTIEIVNSFIDNRIRFYQNSENYERCYSRNKGIELAIGKYILLLDSDDLFEFNHLENWYQFIQLHGNKLSSFYVSDKKIFKGTLFIQRNPVLLKGVKPITYFFLNPIIPGQICVPSSILKQYQFRNDLLIFEDAALWMELASDYNVIFKRLTAIKILLNEKKIIRLLPKKCIRFSLNTCYLGIIRFHDVNSSRFVSFIWVFKSILFFPEYGLKNKILLLMNTIPFISKLNYFKNRKFY